MNKRLAVLIDADNASPAVIGDILSEVATLGVAKVKRIYGNFASPNLAGWSSALLIEHAIQPIQQFSNTPGKNATDIALIIDAMDLLYTRELDGFCLVSSDGDFTRLATRIRENGLSVYGYGEKKTPSSFVLACDHFRKTETFKAKKGALAGKRESLKPSRDLKTDKQLLTAFDEAFEAAANGSDRATMAEFGNHLRKRLPDFKARKHGFGKLSKLVEQLPGWKVVNDHVERS